jgi:hypothetical protein
MSDAATSSSRAFWFHTYDLSQGAAKTYLPLLLGAGQTSVGAVLHSAVVLDGWEYYFEGSVARRPAGRTRFGPDFVPAAVGDPAYQTRVSRVDFEVWLKRTDWGATDTASAADVEVAVPDSTPERAFGLLDYRAITNNCHAFCHAAAEFLTRGAVGAPDVIRCNVPALLSVPVAAITGALLERLAGGLVLQMSQMADRGIGAAEISAQILVEASCDAGTPVTPALLFVPPPLPAGCDAWDEQWAAFEPWVHATVLDATACTMPHTTAPPPKSVVVALGRVARRVALASGPDWPRVHTNAAALLCDALVAWLHPRTPGDSVDAPDADPSDSLHRRGGSVTAGRHVRHRRRDRNEHALPDLLCGLRLWTMLAREPTVAAVTAQHHGLASTLERLMDAKRLPLWPKDVLAQLCDLSQVLLSQHSSAALVRHRLGNQLVVLLAAGLFSSDWGLVDRAAGVWCGMVQGWRTFTLATIEGDMDRHGTAIIIGRAAYVALAALRCVFPTAEQLVEQPQASADPSRLASAPPIVATEEDVARLIEREQSALYKLLLGTTHFVAEGDNPLSICRDSQVRVDGPSTLSRCISSGVRKQAEVLLRAMRVEPFADAAEGTLAA